MNISKISFLLLLALIFTVSACSDDDEDMMSNCTQENWVGTYSATGDCDGESDDLTYTITASGDGAVNIEGESEDESFFLPSITPDGCSFSWSETAGNSSLSLDAVLNGDNLEVTVIETYDGDADTCMFTLTRD